MTCYLSERQWSVWTAVLVIVDPLSDHRGQVLKLDVRDGGRGEHCYAKHFSEPENRKCFILIYFIYLV